MKKNYKNYKERVICIFLLVVLLALPLRTRSVVAQTSEQDSATETTTTSIQNSNNIIKNSDLEPTNSMESSTKKRAGSSETELSIYQEKAIQLKVNQELTSEMIENAVTINNKLKDSTLEFLPEETLFSTIGDKTVNIKIIEKYGEEENEIELPITVSVEKAPEIIAEPNPQDLILGSDSSMWDISDFVKWVRIDGKEVNKNEYIVDLVNIPQTHTVYKQIIKVKVSDKSRMRTILVDVPINIVWGNNIVYQTIPFFGDVRTAGAYTLHTMNKPVVTSANGIHTLDETQVYSGYDPLLQKLFYTFNWFDLSNTQNFLMTEEAKGTKYVEAFGKDQIEDKLNLWGINRKQDVHYGDVVRAWHVFPNWNYLYQNDKKTLYNQGQNSVYYEITPKGYKPLKINFASTKKQKISIGSSDREIIDNIGKSIDLPDGVTARFIKLPSRAKIGDAEGVIRVSQKLSTGKAIEYDYIVPFEIVKDQMTVKFKDDAKFILGQYTNNFDYKSFIQEVKVGNKTLNRDEYNTQLLSKIDNEMLYVGKTGVRLRVSSAQSNNVVENTILVNVNWGQSIAFGGIEIPNLPAWRTAGVYTLQLEEKPQIVATPGNREGLDSQIHYYFTNEDYYKVDYFNMRTSRKIKDTDKGDKSVTVQGQQYPREPVNQWGRVDVNYGDIIRSFAAEKDRHWVYEGDEQKQSFARKNNDYVYY